MKLVGNQAMYDLAMNINTTWPLKALKKISDMTGDVAASKNIGKFFD